MLCRMNFYSSNTNFILDCNFELCGGGDVSAYQGEFILLLFYLQ